jgi:site-specific recombinase XerD
MTNTTQDNAKDCFSDYETWLKKRDTAQKSIRAYLSDAQQFVAWFEQSSGEPFSPAEVDWRDVQNWRDAAEKAFKPATVNRRLSSLRTLFAWAIEKQLVSADPTLRVKGVEQQMLAPKALADEDVRRILRRARKDNLRDWAILELLAATGLRVSEVTALNYGDLELNGKTGWLTVRMGKGKKTRRVPIHEKACEVLKEYLDRKALAGTAPLFSSRLQKPMTPYAIWGLVKKYATEAGVANVTPHSFRHTVATCLVRNPNVDLVTAAAFLGHSRLDTTARYSQPNAEDLEKAAGEL